jgi:hypothetical protein
MRFGINLRGDLTKLDDTEIAARYEKLLAEQERMIAEMPKFAKYKLFRWVGVAFTGRGLLHAPAFYKIQAFVIGLGLALGQTLVDDKFLDRYLSNCEFKDIEDEIKSRIKRRQLVTTS